MRGRVFRIGIIGGRGYVGEELLRLLVPMADREVVFAGSRSMAGTPVAERVPGLETSLRFSELSPESVSKCQADAWIIAQDNGQAASCLPFLSEGSAVVDVSSDFRFDPEWVYGLPERNRQLIAGSRRVSNPGCYATAVQIGLLPLLDQLDPACCPVAFGISGYSGAGRTPSERNDADRLRDNLLPYSLTGHAHEREARHQLGCDVRFVPHVASFFRGLSITFSVVLRSAETPGNLLERFADFYSGTPLTEVTREIPEIATVREKNGCRVGGFAVEKTNPRRLTFVSVLDNLRKGAASQAIENINLMAGLPSHTGLNL